MSTSARDWKNYKRLNFRVFDSKSDFIKKTKEAINYVTNNIESGQQGFFERLLYDPSTDKVLTRTSKKGIAFEKPLRYENEKDLNDILVNFDELVAKIDMGGVFKKSRLRITDDKRGIFDFGIAGKGLYQPKEYFSLELANELPDEFNKSEYGFKPSGIVPNEFVKESFVFNEKQFWYTSFTNGNKYLLTPQDEGLRAIQLKLEGAKKIFKTSIKKSYIMFEKKGGKAKMVELYIPVNQGITLEAALPIFMAAKFFQLYGVMTRINIVRMYQESGSEYVMWSYPVKDYGEEMDFDYMAANGVDTRWWYAIRVGVVAMNEAEELKNYISTYAKKPAYSNIRNYSGTGGLPSDRKSFIALFSRYRNWYMKEIEEGRLQPLRVDKKLIISAANERFYGSFSADLNKITEEFFRIVDTVDFQYNKPEDASKRIYKRMVEEPQDKYYFDLLKDKNLSSQEIVDKMKSNLIFLKADFKEYVQNLLIDTYTYPVDGLYEEPKESARKLDEELNEKLDKLATFLETI